MAEIKTNGATITLTTEEIQEVLMWTAVIDWAAHPLAEAIHVGLGGDKDGVMAEPVTAKLDYDLVQFEKEIR